MTPEEQIYMAIGRAEERLVPIREKMIREEQMLIYKDEQTVTNALEGIIEEMARQKNIKFKTNSTSNQCPICEKFFKNGLGVQNHRNLVSH